MDNDDIIDGYIYKLHELRGRVRGLLKGQLTRFLNEALEASKLDPPWIACIQQRLEDSLKLIEKELERLQ